VFTLTAYDPGQEAQVYTDLSRSELADLVQDLTDLDIKFTFEKQVDDKSKQ
jgi:hypothetical protein